MCGTCFRRSTTFLIQTARRSSPYDETLNNAGVEERRQWSRAVVGQLRKRDLLAEGNTLVIHAGKAYYEELLPLLHDEPVDVKIPNRGTTDG